MNIKHEVGYLLALSTLALSACQEQHPALAPVIQPPTHPTATIQPHIPQPTDITLNLRIPEPQDPSHGCDEIHLPKGFWGSNTKYQDDVTAPGINFHRSWLIQVVSDGILAQHAFGTVNKLMDIGQALYPAPQFPLGKFLGINTCWTNWKTTKMDPITDDQPTA